MRQHLRSANAQKLLIKEQKQQSAQDTLQYSCLERFTHRPPNFITDCCNVCQTLETQLFPQLN